MISANSLLELLADKQRVKAHCSDRVEDLNLDQQFCQHLLDLVDRRFTPASHIVALLLQAREDVYKRQGP